MRRAVREYDFTNNNTGTAEEIVRAIETCPNMEILNLAGNTLGVEAAQEISNALQSRPTLKVRKHILL